MQAEPARRFGDVEAGLDERLVDTLPFEVLDRGGTAAQRDRNIALGPAEGGFDVIGVGGLG